MAHVLTQVQPLLRSFYWRARSLRAKPDWQKIEAGPLEGCMLYLSPAAAWSAQMIQGNYDTFMYDILRTLDLKGATIWDIGAHIGYHTLGFARIAGERGRVHAFEPLRGNFERLAANVAHNPPLSSIVSNHEIALSQSDGKAMFLSSNEVDRGPSMGGHLTDVIPPMSHSTYKRFEEESVVTASADTLLSRGVIDPPDLIKLDVEGAELLVLSGCTQMLQHYKPILLVEIHNVFMMFGVQKLLYGLGYDLTIFHSEPDAKARCFVIAKAIP